MPVQRLHVHGGLDEREGDGRRECDDERRPRCPVAAVAQDGGRDEGFACAKHWVSDLGTERIARRGDLGDACQVHGACSLRRAGSTWRFRPTGVWCGWHDESPDVLGQCVADSGAMLRTLVAHFCS